MFSVFFFVSADADPNPAKSLPSVTLIKNIP